MTPLEVRAYLSERGRAPLDDIAIHFGSSPDAVRQVLQLWIGKGKVRRVEAEGECGKRGPSCGGCGHTPADVYEWV